MNKISYELARELKDAGFPQNVHCNHHVAERCSCEEDWTPTLSELIEACGDKFDLLEKDGSSWYCEGLDSSFRYEGSTPEEAAAKLWLALHATRND